jgi:hypothetical protein
MLYQCCWLYQRINFGEKTDRMMEDEFVDGWIV